MPQEAEPSLNERNFLLRALRENVRLDGRPLHAFREWTVNFGSEYGVANVTLGKTRVVARVTTEVVQPYTDRKFDGIFSITAELSPLVSPAFESNRPTVRETLLTRLIEKAARRSAALDTESLCILAGHSVFHVRLTLHILSHDGGLTDASCVAAIAALRHFRRPDVTVEEGKVRIWDERERVPVPLSVMHVPICVSFSFFTLSVTEGGGGDHGLEVEESEVIVVDATLLESQVSSGELVMTVNRHGEVCQMAKYGGVAVEAVTLLQCANLAVVKAKEIDALISKSLAEDAVRRDPKGLMKELTAENAR